MFGCWDFYRQYYVLLFVHRSCGFVDAHHRSCSVLHVEESYAQAAVALAGDANYSVDCFVFVLAILGCCVHSSRYSNRNR